MEVKDKIPEIKDTNRQIAEDAAYEWWHSVDKDFVDVIDAYVNGVIYGWYNPIKLKEVNLDYIKKELDELIRNHNRNFGWGTLYDVATHFFELGIKSKGE